MCAIPKVDICVEALVVVPKLASIATLPVKFPEVGGLNLMVTSRLSPPLSENGLVAVDNNPKGVAVLTLTETDEAIALPPASYQVGDASFLIVNFCRVGSGGGGLPPQAVVKGLHDGGV